MVGEVNPFKYPPKPLYFIAVETNKQVVRNAIYPKVAILTEPDKGAQRIWEGVADLGRTVMVVADIGGPNQQVGIHHDGDTWPEPNVVLVIDEEALTIENSPETDLPH